MKLLQTLTLQSSFSLLLGVQPIALTKNMNGAPGMADVQMPALCNIVPWYLTLLLLRRWGYLESKSFWVCVWSSSVGLNPHELLPVYFIFLCVFVWACVCMWFRELTAWWDKFPTHFPTVQPQNIHQISRSVFHWLVIKSNSNQAGFGLDLKEISVSSSLFFMHQSSGTNFQKTANAELPKINFLSNILEMLWKYKHWTVNKWVSTVMYNTELFVLIFRCSFLVFYDLQKINK